MANFLQNLAAVAQHKAGQVYKTVANDVAHIGAAPHVVQTNPVQVQQQMAHPTYVQRGLQTPVQRQQFNHTLAQPKQGILQGYKNEAAAGYDAINKVITQPFIGHPLVEVAATVGDMLNRGKNGSTITVPKPLRQFVGEQPVQSIQQKTLDQYKRQSTSSNPVLRVASKPLAAGEAALSVLNDVPVVGSVAKAGIKGVEKVAPKAIPTVVKGGKVVVKESKAAQLRLRQDETAKVQQRQLDQARIELTNRLKAGQAAGLPDNHPAQVGVIKGLQALDQHQMSIQGATRTGRQKLTDKLLTVQPGMSMKPVKAADVPSTTPKLALPDVAKPTPQTPASELPQLKGEASSTVNGTGKQRGLVTSVKNSPQVSPAVQKATNATYQPRSTAKLAAGAEKTAADLEKSTVKVHDALNKQVGAINDKDVADSIAVAKAHDAKGNVQQSSDIYEKLAEHLTKQGQSIQAASLLNHQTPEGLQYGAQKALKKAGVELTPEVQGTLKNAIDEVRKAPAGDERNYAIRKVQKLVSDHTPTSNADKVSSIWKAGLLTGVKTQTGNWLSNGTFQALHTVSNPLAVGIDKAISKFTGVRTKSLTTKGISSGLGEGVKKAGTFLKTGVDERTAISNKYDQHGEINFKNKALNTYVNGVFRLIGAADRPTYYSQLRNSLHDLALTDAVNKGIPRSQVAAHVKTFLQSPTTEAFQIATNEAEKSVLANDTALSTIISGVRQAVDTRIKNPLAKGTASAAINFVAPFTKVPSAFLSRVVDFSPVGAVKEAAMQMSEHKLDQRALSTALSEATTGSALVYLGYQAAKNGLLSGNYPQTDQKEAQRWKADGIQPNSIKVGDKWLSLNYFGPLGLLFNAGQRVSDAAKQGENTAGKAVAAVAGAPKDLMGQSFLQGLSGFTNAVNDPTRSAKTYLNSQLSSVVPTISNDVAQATDKMQRQADTVGQSIQAKIPGMRQGLRSKQDVYGNLLSAKTSPGSQIANPLRPSNDISKNSPVLTEVNRLHSVDPNNKDLQVTPTPVQKVLTIDKNKVSLNDKQAYDLQKQVGQTVQDKWSQLIKTPEYKALDDIGKAKALNNLRTDASVLAQRDYVTKNNLGTYSKAVTAKQGSLANNSDVSNYTKSSTGDTTVNSTIDPHSQKVLNEYNKLDAATRKSKAYKENDYDYKVAQAKYDNAIANNSLSKAQLISQKDAVTRAKVGSSFSKDIREMYGTLNKSEVYNLVTTDPNGKKIASDLLAYGDALKSATGTQNKFRTSKGAISFASAAKGSGSGKAKKAGKYTSHLGTVIKAAQAGNNKAKTYTLAKPSLSGKIRTTAMIKQKKTKLTLNRKA